MLGFTLKDESKPNAFYNSFVKKLALLLMRDISFNYAWSFKKDEILLENNSGYKYKFHSISFLEVCITYDILYRLCR